MRNPPPGRRRSRATTLGLSAAGTTVVANGEYGVFTGKAGEVTVGGPANGDPTFFAGLGTGIFYSKRGRLQSDGQQLRQGPDRHSTSPRPTLAIFVSALENNLPVIVSGNTMRMEGGTGIEVRFGGTEIKEQLHRRGGNRDPHQGRAGSGGVNLIEQNVIGKSTVNGIPHRRRRQSGSSATRSTNQAWREFAFRPPLRSSTPPKTGSVATRTRAKTTSAKAAATRSRSITRGRKKPKPKRSRPQQGRLEPAGLFIDLIGATTNGGIQPPAFATSDPVERQRDWGRAGRDDPCLPQENRRGG